MNSPTAHFEYENGRPCFRVLYESGDSEHAAMTKLGTDLYRVEESLLLSEAVYGDVVRCEPMADGALLFEEITERSKLTTQSWVMSADLLVSDQVRSTLAFVMESGGMWEQVCGGCLIVHTPAEIAQTVGDQIRDASQKA